MSRMIEPVVKIKDERKISQGMFDFKNPCCLMRSDLFLKRNLFIYIGLCWVFTVACRLSLVASSGGSSSSRLLLAVTSPFAEHGL